MKYFIIFFTLLTLVGCKNLEDKIKDKITEEFVDYAEPLSETTSKPSDPARVLPPNPAGCPDWQKGIINKITESITLPQGCRYDRVKIAIESKSDLTLDCNGAELNGLNKEFRQDIDVPYTVSSEPVDIGIRILSHETIPSQNITINNCKLINYRTGIAVLTILTDTSKSDLKNNVNVAAMEDFLRTSSIKNVKIQNTSINYSHINGIFIGRYITDLTVDNTSIKYTTGAGLYLESGTQNNTIKNSTFIGNGHSLYNRKKRARRRILEKDTREAIAIDSSSKNTIQNNVFSNNAAGIYIYKNCYEHHTSSSSLPRYQSADDNLITSNVFKDQKIGVWIASRQSKDLKSFKCGIPRVATDTIKYGPVKETIYIYEDFAKNNRIVSNEFTDVTDGVIVEDDSNTINNNIFDGDVDSDIKIGTKYRTKKLSHPVRDTTITNNQFNSDTSEHVELVYGPVNTIIKDNSPEAVNN